LEVPVVRFRVDVPAVLGFVMARLVAVLVFDRGGPDVRVGVVFFAVVREVRVGVAAAFLPAATRTGSFARVARDAMRPPPVEWTNAGYVPARFASV
jgi:hypothetical protein